MIIPMSTLYRRLRTAEGRLRRKLFRRYDGELFVFTAEEAPSIAPQSLLPEGYAVDELSCGKLERHPGWFAGFRDGRETVRRYLDGGHRIVVVTGPQGDLCGWSMVAAGESVFNRGGILAIPNGTLYFHSQYVLPDYRGRRFGQVLALALLQMLGPGQRGFCFVRRGNRPVLCNWKALGFEAAAAIRCRSRFGRPWRHRVSGATEPVPIPPEAPHQIRLNGPAGAWTVRGIRILRQPPGE